MRSCHLQKYKKFLNDDTFFRVLVRSSTGKQDGCNKLDVEDVTDVFRKKVDFCGKDDTIFRSGCEI